jgi:hypothetical protein
MELHHPRAAAPCARIGEITNSLEASFEEVKEAMDGLTAELVRSWCSGAATALLTRSDLEESGLTSPKEVLNQLRSHLVAHIDGESRAIFRSTVMRKGEAVSSFVSRFRAAAVEFSQ